MKRPATAFFGRCACLVCVLAMAAACSRASGRLEHGRAAPKTIQFWWWGEQEAPGLSLWLEETAKQFERQNPGLAVRTVLQDTDSLADAFIGACAAGMPPDLQCLWGGLYLQEQVFRGWLEPLDNLIPEKRLKEMETGPFGRFRGRQYSAGWYVRPMGILYNRGLFEEAGVGDASSEPRTWAEFRRACGELGKRGVIPMAAGFADGFWGKWYLGFALPQFADDAGDLASLASGLRRFSDEPWPELWEPLSDLVSSGYVNRDAGELTMFQGFELFTAGRAAMVPAPLLLAGPATGALGEDVVGVMSWPATGEGDLAGLPVIDVQGISIPARARHKKEAARFILFMHSEERLNALYRSLKLLPADRAWDGSGLADDPFLRRQWEWYRGAHAPYGADLFPAEFHQEVSGPAPAAAAEGSGGAVSAFARIAATADEALSRWLDANPELAAAYKAWVSEDPGKE